MPTVEGFTPEIARATLYGFFALCLLFLIVFRVYDAFHTIIERRRQRRESEKPDFAKKVSKQVIAELDPRLADIEENLRKDKARLEAHERLIDNIERGQSDVHDGLTAIAKFMLVISTYGNIGTNEKVKEASADLQKFLAERL